MRAKVASHIVYMLLPLQAAVVLPHRMAQNTLWEFLLVQKHTHTPLPVFRRTVDPYVRPCTYFVLSYVMLCFYSSFSHIIRSFYLRYYVKIIFCERNHCLAGHQSFTLIAKFLCSTAESKWAIFLDISLKDSITFILQRFVFVCLLNLVSPPFPFH